MKTKEEILEINKKQAEFYNHVKQNFFTKLWSKFRNGILSKIRKNIGVSNQTYDLHKVWFGNLSEKKVLDLGCFAGNALSLYLAEHAKEYLGADLSDVAIAKLNKNLEKYPHAKAVSVDFLSSDFIERDFDLIYAYGVLHHFPNTTVLIDRLNEVIKPGGEIISYDPLETSWPVKLVRLAYRPFQSDADWEWPFTKKTVAKFSNAFDVVERRGVLGKSKWMFLVNFFPISDQKKKSIGQKWHQYDWEQSAISDKAMFRCMHLTMFMKKK